MDKLMSFFGCPENAELHYNLRDFIESPIGYYMFEHYSGYKLMTEEVKEMAEEDLLPYQDVLVHDIFSLKDEEQVNSNIKQITKILNDPNIAGDCFIFLKLKTIS